ncbi:Phage replication protein O domain protein [Xenorhabdus poinarii G6]|uniref:Phage replication protein O domain protein n=1 Tax=Xenorhabdus poinarii G6 TaxID=1354304 RepID=A0A068R4I3_9GAMM|nr:replication protein [Xenorhabdus poinarii]CDG21035.1 Phage replication protein O domain protein [Xenorhabdus poinarii G6]
MNTAEVYDFNTAKKIRSNRVDNQKLGFIPLYRSIRNKSWAKDVFLRTLWENLLFEAQKGDYVANFKGNIWHLKAGQLVTTPADLGLNLCDRNNRPTSRDAVNRMLAVFVREGMITIEGEKHKGTVITITNYSEYAQKTDDLPAHRAAHDSAHDEASNGAASEDAPAHEGAHKAAHHEQEYILNTNVFNDRPRKSKSPGRVHPDAEVSSPNGNKWGTADDLKTAEWIYQKILVVRPNAKTPNWAAWANDIRLMRQSDNRTHSEICRLFKWANQDSFWYCNILSPAKLREKWDTLESQSTQPNRKSHSNSETSSNWNTVDAWDGFI